MPDEQVNHEAWVNQHKHEPVPASSHAEPRDDQPSDAQPSETQQAQQAQPEPPEGQAVRDMMGGPVPQGDVPDAPATQVAATFDDPDSEPRARYVANAVPGKPDGEVDTRS